MCASVYVVASTGRQRFGGSLAGRLGFELSELVFKSGVICTIIIIRSIKGRKWREVGLCTSCSRFDLSI